MKLITAALAACLLLFTGCNTQPDNGISVLSQPQKPALTVADSSEETLKATLMQNYVRIYEAYCGGAAFSAGKPNSDILRNFAFGWAKENNLLDACAVYSGPDVVSYVLPSEDAASLYEACFGKNRTATEGLSDLRFNADYTQPFHLPELTVSSLEKTGDGGWRLVVNRSVAGRELYPGEYVFAPAAFPEQDTCAFLKAKSPDALWRLVSVQNLPLPEKDSKGRVIKIQTAQELTELARLVNSGDRAYQDDVYLLDADLDLSGILMSPIGSYASDDPRDPAPRGFCTTFDGQGHTICNLTVKGNGLFAGVGNGGFVANLNLESVKIEAGKDSEQPCGGVAGWVDGGWISKCGVSGEISGSEVAGGIAGLVSGGVLQGCRADVTVIGGGIVGGLCGVVDGPASMLTDCTVTGTVFGKASSTAVGGFAGKLAQGTIDRGIASVKVDYPARQGCAGSFVGSLDESDPSASGRLVGCFYDIEAAGGLPAAGIAEKQPNSAALIGMTTEQLIRMGAF